MRVPAAVLALAAVAGAGVAAFEPVLDRRAIESAQALGRTAFEADRRAFHAAYHVEIGQPPVDYLEIVTPFRRVELAAEEAALAGRAAPSQRDALAALGGGAPRVEIVVELTFHPLNTFVGVPGYEVSLLPLDPDEDPVLPAALARVPRHGPRLGNPLLPTPVPREVRVPDSSDPMLGGSLVADFDGAGLDSEGIYDLIVTEGDDEIARVRLDLSLIR